MSLPAKNGLLVASALGLGLLLSARPWMLVRSERALAAIQTRQAEFDEARMVEDRSQEARLQTELGKEALLRHEGYRKPGELPYGP